MTKLISTTAAIAVILAAASSAHADIRRLTMLSTTVTYSDTELASANGAAQVLQRINNAATDLCRPNSSGGQPNSRPTRRCIAQAVSQAVDALDAPMVKIGRAHV